MIRIHFGKKYNAIGVVGRAPQRPPGKSVKVRGRSVLTVSAQALGERRVLQWLTMASETLGEKPIREGVWPFLDARDTVCLRTVSMEWNMPEKCGPHAVLLFFLIQKKAAIVPNSEAFNSFIEWKVRRRKKNSQTSRVKTTWVMARCLLSGCVDLAT